MSGEEPNDESDANCSEPTLSTMSDVSETQPPPAASESAGSEPTLSTFSDATETEPPSPTVSDAATSEPTLSTISESDPDWELATYELRAQVGVETFALMQRFQELEQENRALTACQAVADALLRQRKETVTEAFQRATQLQEELDGLKTKMQANGASSSSKNAQKIALREELKQLRGKILSLTVKLLSKSTANWTPDPADLRRKVDQLKAQIAAFEREKCDADSYLNRTTKAIASTTAELEQKSAALATTVARIDEMSAKLREVEGPGSTLLTEAQKAPAFEAGKLSSGASDRKRHEQRQPYGDRSTKRRRTLV